MEEKQLDQMRAAAESPRPIEAKATHHAATGQAPEESLSAILDRMTDQLSRLNGNLNLLDDYLDRGGAQPGSPDKDEPEVPVHGVRARLDFGVVAFLRLNSRLEEQLARLDALL